MNSQFNKLKNEYDKIKKDNEKEKKDNDILNKKRDEEIKKELTMRDEVLKYKSYKDSYCAEIEQKNLDNYKKDIEDYNKYLKEKVSQDIYKELDAFFDVYIEDFEKKQMEENQQKKAFDTWMPEREPKGYNNSYNYNSYERKPDKGFIRSQLADQNKEADDLKKKETHEFKRGQKYEEEKKKKEKETKEDQKVKKMIKNYYKKLLINGRKMHPLNQQEMF